MKLMSLYQYCKNSISQNFRNMKKSRLTFKKLIGLFVLSFVGAKAASAATLIYVDVSDISAVTFTAVANNSDIDNDWYDTSGGITLLGFLVPAFNIGPTALSGNLSPSGTNETYNQFETPSSDGSDLAGTDLSLFTEGGTDTQTFDTSTIALTGQAQADFSYNPAGLPTPGSTGYIAAGRDSPLQVIGEYLVVPEPGTSALLFASGVLAFLALKRRRGSLERA